ncbi:pantoate--beta-alanine ligase [Sphingobacterium rhinopitheci]|uniref:pantoate--beta-alanine ligase n=1 Tax=Sphingobacterium rhinopitheci TaxID=2781960 RepID=UPI001F525BC3|nr:pantoate--beta-alanine ligase [Sphingobacterium rhinopitheci]MCI0920890.1 pantoate--beta-alanine ligase [Sphingobacterium rhinopitheci]
MNIFKTQEALKSYLDEHRSSNKKIALVPTMGALHNGHLSLIEAANKTADITVCSIFVNPTQFNDPADLEKYPKPIEQDISLLMAAQCDVLFLPSVAEMYPQNDPEWHMELGQLDTIWEGEKRPGHFQGVTQIVYKLFTLVQPDLAYFGQKDFQQVMVIQKMIDIKKLPITIVIHPIVRDGNGLALSSRNTRLSEEGKHKALILYKTLTWVKEHIDSKTISALEKDALEIIGTEKTATLEYFAICETRSLEKVQKIEPSKKYVALIVVWIEGVRLIDNMILN